LKRKKARSLDWRRALVFRVAGCKMGAGYRVFLPHGEHKEAGHSLGTPSLILSTFEKSQTTFSNSFLTLGNDPGIIFLGLLPAKCFVFVDSTSGKRRSQPLNIVAVNRRVASSNLARGAKVFFFTFSYETSPFSSEDRMLNSP